jgi:hypothetical protein
MNEDVLKSLVFYALVSYVLIFDLALFALISSLLGDEGRRTYGRGGSNREE